MFKIERALTGLFGAFKLQSQGNLPYQMRPDVQPVIDLNNFALQAIQPQVTQLGALVPVAAIGPFVTFTQPEDWLVIGADVFSVAGGVGEFLMMSLSWQRNANAQGHTLCFNQRPGAAAAVTSVAVGEERHADTLLFYAPFFSPKGARWVGSVSQVITAGNANASVLHYTLNA